MSHDIILSMFHDVLPSILIYFPCSIYGHSVQDMPHFFMSLFACLHDVSMPRGTLVVMPIHRILFCLLIAVGETHLRYFL